MHAGSRPRPRPTLPVLVALIAVALPSLGGAFTSTTTLSGLFLHEAESGATLAFGPMLEGDASVVALDTTSEPAAAGAPALCIRTPAMTMVGQCTTTTLGTLVAPFSFAINQTGTLQVWLSTGSAAPLPVLGVAGKLKLTNQTGAVVDVFDFRSHRTGTTAEATLAPRGASGNPVAGALLALTATPVRVAFAEVRAQKVVILPGDLLSLDLDVATPLSGPTDPMIRVHFGPSQPSGVLFEVEDAPLAIRRGTGTLPVFPTEGNVSFWPTENATQQLRAFPAAPTAPPNGLVAGSTLSFGPTPLDESTLVLGDGFVEFWVATASGATGPTLDVAFDVRLTIGANTSVAATNLLVNVPAAGAKRFVAPLRSQSLAAAEGDNVTLSFTVYSPNAPNIALAYGSTMHPTGAHLPVLGGGLRARPTPPPPPAPSSSESPPPSSSSSVPAPTSAAPSPQPSPSPSPTSSSPEPSASEAIVEQSTKPGRTPGPSFVLGAVTLLGLATMFRQRAQKGS